MVKWFFLRSHMYVVERIEVCIFRKWAFFVAQLLDIAKLGYVCRQFVVVERCSSNIWLHIRNL